MVLRPHSAFIGLEGFYIIESAEILHDYHNVPPEVYHLEASKFSLYVGNNAGVFHPTNQSHGIFFAQIWNQRIELSLFK